MPLDVVQGASPPLSPSPGDQWLNTANGRYYTWLIGPGGDGAWVVPSPGDQWLNPHNGRYYTWLIGLNGRGAWVTSSVRAVAGRAPDAAPVDAPTPLLAPPITNPTPKITSADIPPSTPAINDLWFDTGTGFLFIWYYDGNTYQWVVTNPGRGSDVPPPATVVPSHIESDPGIVLTPDPLLGIGSIGVDTTWLDARIATEIPANLPPSGLAGGDLAGSYPDPVVKASVALGGNPTAVTQATSDNSQRLATTAFVKTNIAAIPAPPVVTVPAGSVAYGGVGGAVTGVLADFSWDTTNKRLGVGKGTPTASVDIVSTVNNGPIFNAVGVANSSAAQTWFHVSVADPTGGSGSSFRIDGGTTGGLGLFDIDRTGDCNMAGWLRILQQTGPPAGGAYYYGIYLGSSTTGNLGFFGGTGAPTLDTFGAFGSIYMNKASPGIPYYNVNGSTGWDQLVGRTATQTLTNKTFAPTSISPGTNGQVLTTVAGAAAWAATSGGAPATAVGVTPPGSPTVGQLWYYSDASTGGGSLYIWYDDGNTQQWVPAVVQPSGMGAPAGSVMDFAGATAPAGWLLCNGQLVSRTTYPMLFAAIGTTYGVGDGSTTFAVPDLGGRVTAGKEATATRLTTAGAGIDGATLGATGGVQTYALLDTQNAAHSHGYSDPTHTHTSASGYSFATANAPGWAAFGGGGVNVGYAAITGSGIGITISSSGSSLAHQNTQPTMIMNKIIKT